ncbi:hypothetical protein P5673_026241 [Acropora cervicornis]|uniref:Uncharacterized protein n=1 Tax=Acropora cervicornis TaxID=6130 RepID=A0AAD9UWX2_ACRCE|nr:hypothetical protein P5673_026241 [Acropora cervicornis]
MLHQDLICEEPVLVDNINRAFLNIMKDYQPLTDSVRVSVEDDEPITVIEELVEKKLREISTSRAIGPDELPNWVLKEYSEVLAAPIIPAAVLVTEGTYLSQHTFEGNVDILIQAVEDLLSRSDPLVGKLQTLRNKNDFTTDGLLRYKQILKDNHYNLLLLEEDLEIRGQNATATFHCQSGIKISRNKPHQYNPMTRTQKNAMKLCNDTRITRIITKKNNDNDIIIILPLKFETISSKPANMASVLLISHFYYLKLTYERTSSPRHLCLSHENWPLPLCGLLNPFFSSSSYTPEPCTNKPFPGTDGDEG